MSHMRPITDSNVVYFESKEHMSGLIEMGSVLAKFHQTWCGHCKTMKKHFEKASQSFARGGPIHLVDIDCGQHAGFCSEHSVSGYPTVKLFSAGGKSEAYEQARTYTAMTAFLQGLPAHVAKAEL